MDIGSYNLGMFLFFYLCYIVIGLGLGIRMSQQLSTYEPVADNRGENISFDANTRIIRLYNREIGTFFGIMWPILLVFFLSVDLGLTIYYSFIYNGNEEDRIASWLV